MLHNRAAVACLFMFAVGGVRPTQAQECGAEDDESVSCEVRAFDRSGCSAVGDGACLRPLRTTESGVIYPCWPILGGTPSAECGPGCWCESGVCFKYTTDEEESVAGLCIDPDETTSPCPEGTSNCGDPHMVGLRGQAIDWSGVDGGWYALVKDEEVDIHVNVRLTAPLPVEYPKRQLMTGISILSQGHSLVIEVKDPYTVATEGCPHDALPCLADGGLRITVDGQEDSSLLGPSRDEIVADCIRVSASNLPVECRQFGGDRIWAKTYHDMLESGRHLEEDQSFEDWVLTYRTMAAPEWCIKYVAENGLEDVQSNYALFNIAAPNVAVRLHVGISHQGNGETDSDGRILPELDFWQMDIGVDGINVDHEFLSGILGETSHPMFDTKGHVVMAGPGAMRGKVDDYRVSGATGTDFSLIKATT